MSGDTCSHVQLEDAHNDPPSHHHLLLDGVFMLSPALSVPGMAQDVWEPKDHFCLLPLRCPGNYLGI